MAKVQDILVFYQTSPALDVSPVAWARYEASKGTGIKELIEDCLLKFELDNPEWELNSAQTFAKKKRKT